jgi:hypothetical protein
MKREKKLGDKMRVTKFYQRIETLTVWQRFRAWRESRRKYRWRVLSLDSGHGQFMTPLLAENKAIDYIVSRDMTIVHVDRVYKSFLVKG